MPLVKIDGVEHEFREGINVLEACEQIGVHIPHFCYHPSLKVVGSCRMCKVEVELKGRKWVDISCNVIVADEMSIVTDSPAVLKARQMTLEFLLANHPVDCPICDDAGECELQNYYMAHGLHDSEMGELKRRKHKAVDIGNSIVLDSERCVLCSRCVRFCEEITGTHELGIFGMGATEELMVRPGARLDNDYSGNVVDLCPVGALTDKDFRFKRRVWYLQSANSICQLCGRGCNVRIDYDIDPYHEHKKNIKMKTHRTDQTQYARIQRIKPRPNKQVNDHWICNHGRYGYRPTDDNDRLLHARIKEGDSTRETGFSEAVKLLASGINAAVSSGEKLFVAVSPNLTNEELYAIWSLFRHKLGLVNIDHKLPIDPGWYGDNILRTPDPFPNRTGCEWMELTPGKNGVSIESLSEAIGSKKIDTLLSILVDPLDYLEEDSLKRLKNVFVITRNISEKLEGKFDLALPAASWGEYRGTFTNFQGRLQRLDQAFEPLGDSVPVWKLMTELSSPVKKSLGWNTYKDVFTSMTTNVGHFKNITWEEIGDQGKPLA